MTIPLLSAILAHRALRQEFRAVDAEYQAFLQSDLAKACAVVWRCRHRLPPVGVGNWHNHGFGVDMGPCEPPNRYLRWEIDYRRNAMEGREQCFGCGSDADNEPGVLFDWNEGRAG